MTEIARYRCVWCGGAITVKLPWQGRPQGPQCMCNPNSWGNWQRVPDGVQRPSLAMGALCGIATDAPCEAAKPSASSGSDEQKKDFP
jgi:hypothetical protein